MDELKEIYAEHQKLRDLPALEKLDELFGVGDLDEYSNLLKRIRLRIAEHIEEFAKFIEEKITPDNNIRNIFEYKAFDEKKKDELFDIYKKLMFLLRWSTELDLLLDEEKDAEFIKDVTDKWPSLKDKLHKLLTLVKDSWKKENNIKEHVGYMG